MYRYFRFVLTAMITLLIYGCLAPPDYTYEHIQQEYAETVCRLAPDAQGKKVASDPRNCRLAGPLRLDAAIGIALDNNPDIKMAMARIQQAQAGLNQSRALFWPSVRLYTEYMQGDAPSAYLFKTIDQRQLPPNTNFNDPGWFQNFESGVQGAYNLFNGGQDWLSHKMAATGLSISHADRSAMRNMLTAATIRAYYDVLAAQHYIEISQESVDTVAEQLRVMRVRFNAGGALKSDILSLEVRLAQAKEALLISQNKKTLALTALIQVLGTAPDQELELADGSAVVHDLPATYEAAVAYTIAHRPEIKKIKQQIMRQRMAMDQIKGQYLPRLDAVGRYYVDDDAMGYNLDRDNWTAALMLNWDLFTGLSTRADRQRARAMLEELLAADHKTVLDVKMDVKNAYANLDAAGARLQVATSSVAAAEESLSLVKRQYEGGSATITRYLEAELDRSRSQLNHAVAYFDQRKSEAEVARAIGYWADAQRASASKPQSDREMTR